MAFLKKCVVKTQHEVHQHLPEFLLEETIKKITNITVIKAMEEGNIFEIKKHTFDPLDPDSLGTLNSVQRRSLTERNVKLIEVSVIVYEKRKPLEGAVNIRKVG